MRVEQVKGWKASDGTLHETEYAALEHEAEIQLIALDIFNSKTREAIFQHKDKIIDILSALPRAQADAARA